MRGMEDGRAADGDTDTEGRAGLAAIWGREASATAPPAPRPDLDALFAPTAPAAGGEPPRRRRGPVLAGLAVAVVAAVVAASVVLGDEDGPAADPVPPSPAGRATTTVPAADELGPPAWTAATVCPRFEDPVTGGGTTACPLALDDERAYVLVDGAGTPSLRALDAVTGQVRWEQPFPEGARTVERLPSVVVVGGVGGRPPTNEDPGTLSEVVALDPVTGERRWSRPGLVVGPVGRDHLVVDATAGGAREAMSVVEASTGREVLRRESDVVSLFLHPCGGMVLASEDDRLTAHDVVDGSVRWSIPAPHHDGFHPLACDLRRIAYVEAGTVVLLDAGTGSRIGAVRATATVPDGDPQVRAIVGDTVVVGSVGGVRGYRADAGMEEIWDLPCSLCGPDVPVGPAGEDAVVVLGGEAVVRGGDGRTGLQLDLRGRSEKVLRDDTLLAWGAGRVVVADTAGLGRPAAVVLDDVRTADASATHVVVATRDEVRAYAREG